MTKDSFQDSSKFIGKTEDTGTIAKANNVRLVPFGPRAPEPKPPFGMPVAMQVRLLPQVITASETKTTPAEKDEKDGK